MTSTVSPTHAGPAWLLVGLGNVPGVLALRDGRLSFIAAEGVVFDEPLDRLGDVTFPWYWFSGGFRVEVAGVRRRLSLTRPNGAPGPGAAVLDLAGVDALELLGAAGSLQDVAAGRRRGRTWRALLAGG